MKNNQQLKIQNGRRNSDVTELQIMMSGMSEERKQRIMDKADRLEVFFKDDVLYMKDKDEGWDGMLSEDVNNDKGNN